MATSGDYAWSMMSMCVRVCVCVCVCVPSELKNITVLSLTSLLIPKAVTGYLLYRRVLNTVPPSNVSW